jgi:protein-L-isoaspartate O-methyltransferase
MIIPLGSTRDTQSLVEIEKTDGGVAKRPLLPVRFVPLLHGRVKPGERS